MNNPKKSKGMPRNAINDRLLRDSNAMEKIENLNKLPNDLELIKRHNGERPKIQGFQVPRMLSQVELLKARISTVPANPVTVRSPFRLDAT